MHKRANALEKEKHLCNEIDLALEMLVVDIFKDKK